MADQFEHDGTVTLRDLALGFPGVNEGDSCVKRAFRAKSKGFLYLGEKVDTYNVMVKVGPSADEVTAFCAEAPDTRSLGKGGWATFHFAADEPAPDLVKSLIDESYRIQAPKTLLRELDAE